MDPFSIALGLISAIVGAGVSGAKASQAARQSRKAAEPPLPSPEFKAPTSASLSSPSGSGLRDPGSVGAPSIDPNSIQIRALRDLMSQRKGL